MTRRQRELIEEIHQKRWELIKAAWGTEAYGFTFAPQQYLVCSRCGTRHAPAAPMLKDADWQRICKALGVTEDVVLCQACAELGNGGRIALSQLTPCHFNIDFVLTEHIIPVEGTEEERELLDYFSRYALKVIPQREAYMKTRRRHEEEANLNPLTSENITLRK